MVASLRLFAIFIRFDCLELALRWRIVTNNKRKMQHLKVYTWIIWYNNQEQIRGMRAFRGYARELLRFYKFLCDKFAHCCCSLECRQTNCPIFANYATPQTQDRGFESRLFLLKINNRQTDNKMVLHNYAPERFCGFLHQLYLNMQPLSPIRIFCHCSTITIN